MSKMKSIGSLGLSVIKAVAGLSRGLKSFSCSRFARLEAEKRFGIKYQPAHAWDRKYTDNVINLEGKTLDERFDEGVLKPGMIVGLFNPNSLFLNGTDKKGNLRAYTHVALCLARSQYTHQYGSEIRIDNEDELKNLGLSPVEILASN
ncbi:MAG TPA: hypothetical protein VJB94_05250 [Candidatus Nanoarchaeia archaeon]|nr:hypothetical protein [Candidatus Nanoarchaeia archaeon]